MRGTDYWLYYKFNIFVCIVVPVKNNSMIFKRLLKLLHYFICVVNLKNKGFGELAKKI